MPYKDIEKRRESKRKSYAKNKEKILMALKEYRSKTTDVKNFANLTEKQKLEVIKKTERKKQEKLKFEESCRIEKQKRIKRQQKIEQQEINFRRRQKEERNRQERIILSERKYFKWLWKNYPEEFGHLIYVGTVFLSNGAIIQQERLSCGQKIMFNEKTKQLEKEHGEVYTSHMYVRVESLGMVSGIYWTTCPCYKPITLKYRHTGMQNCFIREWNHQCGIKRYKILEEKRLKQLEKEEKLSIHQKIQNILKTDKTYRKNSLVKIAAKTDHKDVMLFQSLAMMGKF